MGVLFDLLEDGLLVLVVSDLGVHVAYLLVALLEALLHVDYLLAPLFDDQLTLLLFHLQLMLAQFHLLQECLLLPTLLLE